jgi:hypothetical protein
VPVLLRAPRRTGNEGTTRRRDNQSELDCRPPGVRDAQSLCRIEVGGGRLSEYGSGLGEARYPRQCPAARP